MNSADSADAVEQFIEKAKCAAARGDHRAAETFFQDAILSHSASEPTEKLVEAFTGLADSIDARGGDSALLRAVTQMIKDAKITTDLQTKEGVT